MELGNRIKSLRKEKGVTQEALADAAGVSVQAVSKWECGQSCPDIALLPALADFFGVTIDRMLRDTTNTDVSAGSFPDDDILRVAQFRGRTLLQLDNLNGIAPIPLAIPADARIENMVIHGSANISGHVNGNVTAMCDLHGGIINGNATAGCDLYCAEIGGGARAGISIHTQ